MTLIVNLALRILWVFSDYMLLNSPYLFLKMVVIISPAAYPKESSIALSFEVSAKPFHQEMNTFKV